MRSIKTKGMAFAVSIILIAISALGISSFTRFKKTLLDEVHVAVERIANESADHISSYIEQFITPLVGISMDPDIISMDFERQRMVIENQINPQYLNVAVVDKNGTAHYFDGDELDLSDREYVKKALSGNIALSDIIISRKTNTPVIMAAVPIIDNGEIKGALIARLNVDFLSDFALSRGYGANGMAYIISSSGNLISRPEDMVHEAYSLQEIAKEDSRYQSLYEFVEESRNKDSGYGVFQIDNTNILMGYASVEETDWKIFIGTDEAYALRNLKGIRQMMTVEVALTILLSTLIAWIVISQFTKPIIELDNLFSQGARGNLTIRFTPRTKDEIGRLGVSFNRMMDKIKTLTQYDPLTSLLNQYVLEKDIDSLTSSEEPKNISLIMIAIDRFNQINETYGYTVGDAMLVEVAKRALSCVNEHYQVYRYKGDEFVILGKSTYAEKEIDSITQELIRTLKESYYIDNRVINIDVSIGVFHWNDETREENPLKAVTHAKNYAKYLGGNQVQKFDIQIYNKLVGMKDLQADILHGLKQEQFLLVYQPLFRLDNEKIAEVEALIRWNHPQKGLLYPDQFIELAEQSGTIINIDYWVIEKACKQLLSWKQRQVPPIMVSINISAKTFETKRFIPNLVEIVQRYGVNPALLQLEITERMVIKNVEDSIAKLRELRSMGIRVAIDDFGIGYSSLSYIVKLPIDCVKIDKSFVQNITSSKEAKIIVSTIINLCKKLSLNVVAEGIENKVELDYLKSNQCDIGQGYYFSKPVHIKDIEKSYILVKA